MVDSGIPMGNYLTAELSGSPAGIQSTLSSKPTLLHRLCSAASEGRNLRVYSIMIHLLPADDYVHRSLCKEKMKKATTCCFQCHAIKSGRKKNNFLGDLDNV